MLEAGTSGAREGSVLPTQNARAQCRISAQLQKGFVKLGARECQSGGSGNRARPDRFQIRILLSAAPDRDSEPAFSSLKQTLQQPHLRFL